MEWTVGLGLRLRIGLDDPAVLWRGVLGAEPCGTGGGRGGIPRLDVRGLVGVWVLEWALEFEPAREGNGGDATRPLGAKASSRALSRRKGEREGEGEADGEREGEREGEVGREVKVGDPPVPGSSTAISSASQSESESPEVRTVDLCALRSLPSYLERLTLFA